MMSEIIIINNKSSKTNIRKKKMLKQGTDSNLPINTIPKGTIIHLREIALRLKEDIKVEGGIPEGWLEEILKEQAEREKRLSSHGCILDISEDILEDKLEGNN